MDNNHTYLHGRLDPGRDESLWGLESVEAREPERELPRVDDNSLLSTQNGKLSRETIQLCPLTGMSDLIACPETKPDLDFALLP